MILFRASLLTAGLLLSSCLTQPAPVTNTPLAADTVVGQDCAQPVGICLMQDGESFALIEDGIPATIETDGMLDAPVLTAIESVRADLQAVAGSSETTPDRTLVVATIGASPLLDELSARGLIDLSPIEDQWEGYVQAVVDAPDLGLNRALVIAGSDARGTVFGLYDLSERIGVSPWHWWADVPIIEQDDLYVSAGQVSAKPDVQYRGIFLNDENPALYGWVHENFEDGFGDGFYARVFELILRHKGNYIWPAMWGKAYYDDDPDNVALARNMGVVVGTSHHEPLGRAHVEWDRYGEGAWDYNVNADFLQEFWSGGMERMKDNEVLVTIGMRGDGDEAMTEGTAIELLERIVSDQRDVIEDVTGRPAAETPQVWALYKEVQDYYDQGMEVPDDVLLLFADDNWGNIRRLPQPGSERPGGYGVYYHFDYVGGPRNYKWLNTTQIERVYEQMHTAREYGADRLWIVNVGDLKPMEFPISHFLDLAWDPESQTAESLPLYYTDWSERQFGETYGEEIGQLIKGYTRLNARRKPELLEPGTYSLTQFNEAPRVTQEWNDLEQGAEALRARLDPAFHDAFDQLVWWPIMASANLHDLYVAAEKNRLYAEQGRATANLWADEVDRLFERDAELTDYYHTEIADGKWNHFASQTHIGYTYWQQPDQNKKPETVRLDIPREGQLGLSVPGSETTSVGGATPLSLPRLDTVHSEGGQVTLFNTGTTPIDWTASTDMDGLRLLNAGGTLDSETTLAFDFIESDLSEGVNRGEIQVSGSDGTEQTIRVEILKPELVPTLTGYLPRGGIIAIEADGYSEARSNGAVDWTVIEGLSRTGSAVTSLPVTAEPSDPSAADAPYLAYDLVLDQPGTYRLYVTVAPSLDTRGAGGLRFATSVGDAAPQIHSYNLTPDTADWNTAVSDYAHVIETDFTVDEAGQHRLKIWRVDPGVVLQRITVSQTELPYSYLGSPSSLTVADVRSE